MLVEVVMGAFGATQHIGTFRKKSVRVCRPSAAMIAEEMTYRILKDVEGATIRLTDERLQHILDRPEMVGLESSIEETLVSPEIVIRSRSDPEARLYYRYYAATVASGKFLCVVVKSAQADAFVITAYLTDRVKKGEQLWPERP